MSFARRRRIRCDDCRCHEGRMAETSPACQRERMATDAVALTRDLVRFDTLTAPGAEAACAQQVARLLETAGSELGTYDFAPGRTSLMARIGGRPDAPPLCFTGHLDTVPLGEQPWTH